MRGRLARWRGKGYKRFRKDDPCRAFAAYTEHRENFTKRFELRRFPDSGGPHFRGFRY